MAAEDYYTSTQKPGTAYFYTFDLLERVDGLDTVVDSAVWAIESGVGITISDDSVTSTTAKAKLTATSTGIIVLTCTVTYDSTEVSVLHLTLTVSA